MPVSFAQIAIGTFHSRRDLATIWDYSSMHAIARGVVTPRNDNKIILFVTREKQAGAEQYQDELSGTELHWEGPTDHFAEERMLASSKAGEEIHLFYRERHHSDFEYFGMLELMGSNRHSDRPSEFVFKLKGR